MFRSRQTIGSTLLHVTTPSTMSCQMCLILAMIFSHESTATFHVRPSTTSTLSMAELRATNCHKHEQMYSCYIGCLQDPCCLAVKLAEECEMSYFPTEAMDLVKEASVWEWNDWHKSDFNQRNDIDFPLYDGLNLYMVTRQEVLLLWTYP